MPLSTVIEIVIGTAYVYFFFSLLASGINEWYARLVNRRATVLRTAITQLLGSVEPPAVQSAGKPGPQTLAEQFYSHPIIAGLKEDGNDPSYIPPAHFSLALLDLMKEQPERDTAPKTVVNLSRRESQVLSALAAGETSPRVIDARIQKWFTDSGQRISGQYKRATYKSLLLISCVLSAAFGVDSISLVQHLYQDPVQRELLVAQARASNAAVQPPGSPIGIGNMSELWFLGIAITALALTLGSPFWFEFLNRFVNLRQTGKPPEPQLTNFS